MVIAYTEARRLGLVCETHDIYLQFHMSLFLVERVVHSPHGAATLV